jgi:hypothetical protein
MTRKSKRISYMTSYRSPSIMTEQQAQTATSPDCIGIPWFLGERISRKTGIGVLPNVFDHLENYINV